jgi:ABC-2 type transport system permease protein
VLCGAIEAMNFGISIISKETRERTADFLLAKPVSRTAIVNAKLLAALTMLLATDVLYYAVASIMASAIATGYSNKLFFMVNITLLFVQLIFFALGVIVSVIFNKLKSVLPVSLGVVFGLYIIGALIATGPNDASRFISPFRYFDSAYIVKNASYEAPYVIAGAVIVIVAIAASYFIYNKKDTHAVS